MRSLALVLLAASFAAHAQPDPLAGVIDIHVHAAPDSTPRSIDAVDLARLAESRGMRALVLKNHFAPTAADAYLVHKAVPGILVFGGVDLNLSVGGMNPSAVEHMALTTGHLGRFVWMATTDTCAAVAASHVDRPCVAVSQHGALLPETRAVLDTIARYNLVLATGHNSAEDGLLLLHESHARGISRMVVTHAMLAPTSMSIAQMKEAAALGAYLEFVYNGLTGHPLFTAADYARAIRAVGPAHCILSSDMGQPTNPLHPDALVLFFTALRAQGLTDAEIRKMSIDNPARLLDLPPVPHP